MDDDAAHDVAVEEPHDLLDVSTRTVVHVDAEVRQGLDQLRPLQEPRAVQVHAVQMLPQRQEAAHSPAFEYLRLELFRIGLVGFRFLDDTRHSNCFD